MQPPKRPRRRHTELKVFLDTNALFSGSASDLLSLETQHLIRENQTLTDPKLTWCIPAIVLLERNYQMKTRALELLPSVQKLERLLGHNLNITEDIVETRIRDTIQTQIRDFGITVIDLDYSGVNWTKLVTDSAFRIPPFEAGDKEKGFRDSIILETFVQLVTSSPSTAQVCRIILVTNDDLLTRAASARTSSNANVTCLPTLNDLAGLINTLASEVPEEYVAELERRAKAYFFAPGEATSLFHKQDVKSRISAEFSAELEEIPPGADLRTNLTWYISAPRFLRKERQRVFWASRISVEAKAHKYPRQGLFLGGSALDLSSEVPLVSGSPIGSRSSVPDIPEMPTITPKLSSEGSKWSHFASTIYGTSGLVNTGLEYSTATVQATGRSVFEVTWSISVDSSKRFSHPSVESIDYVGTTWE